MKTQHFLLPCPIQLKLTFSVQLKSCTLKVNYLTLDCTSNVCTRHAAE